jgi:hypothetical protein
MKLTVSLDEHEIRKILAEHLTNKFRVEFDPRHPPIEVKSKQNYKSEWETATIRIQTEIIV